eukprot:scaffold35875_cov112-Isochrysis_galbana.AAC.1
MAPMPMPRTAAEAIPAAMVRTPTVGGALAGGSCCEHRSRTATRIGARCASIIGARRGSARRSSRLGGKSPIRVVPDCSRDDLSLRPWEYHPGQASSNAP